MTKSLLKIIIRLKNINNGQLTMGADDIFFTAGNASPIKFGQVHTE